MIVEVTRDDFSIDTAVDRLKKPGVGAILTYVGTVREFPSGIGLQFEDDAGAAEGLRRIAGRAVERFDVDDVAIVHRLGLLRVSERIILVAVSSAHRGPAFEACSAIVDEIKELHSSWAKEVRQ